MMLRKWEDLPQEMRTEEVRPYYDLLRRKQGSLLCKRLFDILASLVLLVLLSPVFLVLAIAIKLDSHGPVFYRQVRVTQYGREFRIFKFRTMVQNADRIGSQVTVSGDSRITRVGKVIRSCRLDEIGQLLNVLGGSMSFVGTRPEVPKYVARYTPEMMATLPLAAGGDFLGSRPCGRGCPPGPASATRTRRSCWTRRRTWTRRMCSRCCRGKWHIIWRASGALAWGRSC